MTLHPCPAPSVKARPLDALKGHRRERGGGSREHGDICKGPKGWGHGD